MPSNIKRLQKEFLTLQKSQPNGIVVTMPNDDINVWHAKIPGPVQSLYKGGIFKVQITIPDEYPLAPPLVHFLTPIYHVNVSQSCGQVCLAFLHADNWVAGATIEQIVNAIYSLMIKPEVENSFDHDVLNTYTHYEYHYEQKAKASVTRQKFNST